MTNPDDPDLIRRDIERTQRNLSSDVDRLTDKVTPGRIVHRRMSHARRAMTNMRERVMGTTTSSGSMTGGGSTTGGAISTAQEKIGEGASTLADNTSSAASSVAQAVEEAPQAIRRGTEGNPLAAGLIAFGAGWLLSSLVPASKVEQQLAEQAKDAAQEYGRPVAEHLGHAAEEVRDNMREPAQQAVESVKDTATDAAGTVADEAKNAASDVGDRAEEAKSSVQRQQGGH
ncbi:MAG TPA: DUF3618 domain-containing protein [Actinophytocola sp.]|jgi:hypothetical protein|nr:DUF3618 domain-containing protein [Actinophytocola sp.]